METVVSRWAPGLGMCLVLAWLAAVPAHAAEGTFRVRAVVPVARDTTTAWLDSVPMPTGATRLTRSPSGDSYWFRGPIAAAAAHFQHAMQAQGYTLLHASEDASSLSWSDAIRRIDVRMHPVLGDGGQTRIVVEATPVS